MAVVMFLLLTIDFRFHLIDPAINILRASLRSFAHFAVSESGMNKKRKNPHQNQHNSADALFIVFDKIGTQQVDPFVSQ
jgi:hypothetical protein